MRAVVGLVVPTVLCACRAEPCERPGTVCTVAGVPGVAGFDGDGRPARETMLYFPSALALDPEGRLVIDDFNNQRIRVLTAEGTLETVAGNGFHAYAVPGEPALETPLENPVDIGYLPDGRLLIAELHGARILRVEDDGTITSIAGRVGEPGLAGDGGPATDAFLSEAAGVAASADGEVWIADTDNHCVRRVDTDGWIWPVVGDGTPGAEDGPVPRLNGPQHLTVRGDDLWIADAGNHLVRHVDRSTGRVRTVAGTGQEGFSGDGGPATEARLRSPWAVEPDGQGGLWIADAGNNRVRHVDTEGIIETRVGSGRPRPLGEEVDALEASLDFPADVLPDGDGGLWIADLKHNLVRHVAGPLLDEP